MKWINLAFLHYYFCTSLLNIHYVDYLFIIELFYLFIYFLLALYLKLFSIIIFVSCKNLTC